ncbi:hypothetical protein GGTG_13754 [Gaeumannomyces tritici R3-111a-1]|uniref:Aminoglycoside phosphotransferase domain-containing protein n=1 Tax=Gaeumannomyces tritici (strain R3-111a-1) TaxID=644352 RepID=J3PJR5_GAET3|nr:hypothetical protein GGTG_13754 [Gaeumannomyces tritici R3-111a-1]EJT68680.1 hypothetical protein GGTG_13754 [Gaeumannomyces tritici R3-111a-1]
MAHQADTTPAPTAAELEMHRPPTAAELEEMYPTPIDATQPSDEPLPIQPRKSFSALTLKDFIRELTEVDLDEMYPPTPIEREKPLFRKSLDALPLKDSIREVLKYRTEVVETPTEWIIGGRLLLTHHPLAESPPAGKTSWPGGERDKGYYTLEDAPQPLPWSRPVREGRFEEWRKPYSQLSIRRIGEADLKVSLITYPFETEVTREHVVLEWLAQRKEHFSFDFPQVLHHHQLHGRYFLLVRRPEGKQLQLKAASMSDQEKEDIQRCLRRIISKELGGFTGHGQPQAVDGGVPAMKGTAGDLYLAHVDIASNVLVGDDNKIVTIANWELASLLTYCEGVCRDMLEVEKVLWMPWKPFVFPE